LRGFENKLLRRIFRHKREKLTGGQRKLHNEDIYNLYFSPSSVRVIKSKKMRLVGHVDRKDDTCILNFNQVTSSEEFTLET
jgi:hypothetical protein